MALGRETWKVFFEALPTDVTLDSQPDHRRDAVISAVAAREGFEGRWKKDLIDDRYRERIRTPVITGSHPFTTSGRHESMEFRIADTFTDSLARLTGDEQKAVKTTAFDLQLNPANPGMSFHKLDKAKDKNFWSVRVSSDIRLIVHKSEASLLLCYVGSSRQGLRLGRTAQTGDASQDGRRTVGRDTRDGEGGRRPGLRADGNCRGAETGGRDEAPLRRDVRRRTARLRRARRVAQRRQDRQPRTRCWPWPTTCLPRLRRRCWNWRPVASRACPSLPRWRRVPSIIPTPSAASG